MEEILLLIILGAWTRVRVSDVDVNSRVRFGKILILRFRDTDPVINMGAEIWLKKSGSNLAKS